MTVWMDKPFTWPTKPGLWSHLWSDLVGVPGREELDWVARKLGLKRDWLQHAGTHREHYDLCKGAIDRARALVSETTTRAFARDCRAKRAWQDRARHGEEESGAEEGEEAGG